MKKIVICCVAAVLLVALAVGVAVQGRRLQKISEEHYSWLRSECESAACFIKEYQSRKDEKDYTHAIARVYGALVVALMIEDDEAIDALSLELNRAYGHLTQRPDLAKQELLRLGEALWSFGTEGSVGKAEVEINSFNNAIDALAAVN